MERNKDNKSKMMMLKKQLLRARKNSIAILDKAFIRLTGRTPVTSNYFKRANDGPRVLISYIRSPFTEGLHFKHTNARACLTAATIFDELGYVVDAINYNSTNTIDYSRYQVIYGFGDPMEQSFFYKDNKRIKKIIYGTGCSGKYSDMASLRRFKAFYDDHGTLLHNSLRLSEKSYSFQSVCSDAVISLGNEFVAGTYRVNLLNENVLPINNFYFDFYDIDLNGKDFSRAKKHFLWFGSNGLLHKGLDLTLDFFKQRKDLVLHICGARTSEKEFFNCYSDELSNQPDSNIINHGFVNLEGGEFKEIMDLCGAVIFPSISEGGSPSLLNVIANGGLIPIVSEFSGVDLPEYGFIMKDLSVGSIQNEVEKYLDLSIEETRHLSMKAKDDIRQNYSYENYKFQLKEHLRSILGL